MISRLGPILEVPAVTQGLQSTPSAKTDPQVIPSTFVLKSARFSVFLRILSPLRAAKLRIFYDGKAMPLG